MINNIKRHFESRNINLVKKEMYGTLLYLKYCACLSLPATDRIISGHLKQEMGTKVSYASCHLQHNDYPIFSSSDDYDHTEYVHSHG